MALPQQNESLKLLLKFIRQDRLLTPLSSAFVPLDQTCHKPVKLCILFRSWNSVKQVLHLLSHFYVKNISKHVNRGAGIWVEIQGREKCNLSSAVHDQTTYTVPQNGTRY